MSASRATPSQSTASARSRRKRKRRTSVASRGSMVPSPARSRSQFRGSGGSQRPLRQGCAEDQPRQEGRSQAQADQGERWQRKDPRGQSSRQGRLGTTLVASCEWLMRQKGRRLILPPFCSASWARRGHATRRGVVLARSKGCLNKGVSNESPDCIIYRTNSVSLHAKPSRRVAELSKANTAANASASGATSLDHSRSCAIGVRGIASVRSLRVSGNSDWRPNEESEAEVSFLENTLSSF